MTARPVSAYQRFFFELRSRESLCLVRLFTGLVLCVKLTHLYGLWRVERLSISLPHRRFPRPEDYLLEGFRLPVPGFEWLPAPSYQGYLWLENALLALAALVMLGLFTRVVVPALALLLSYWLLLSEWFYTHHMPTFVLVLWVLAFSRCDEHFSLDAARRGDAAVRPARVILPVRQLQLLVTAVYFQASFGAKMNAGWITGQVMADLEHAVVLNGYLAGGVLAVLPAKLLGFLTVVVETALVFGLWLPRARRWCIFAGVLLHAGIDMLMNVGTFSYQMFALYIAFVTPEGGRTRVALAPGVWARLLRALDWLGRFTLEAPRADRRLQVTLDDGRVLHELEALREVLTRTPLTFVPGCLLYLPVFRDVAVVLWPRGSADT